MRKLLTATAAVFIAMPALAGELLDRSAQNARVYGSEKGFALSAAGPGGAEAVNGFLATKLQAAGAMDSLVVTGEHVAASGRTHFRMGQEVAGLKVYGTYVKAAVNERGEVVHLIENLVVPPTEGVAPAAIGPQQALETAVALHHGELKMAFVESGSGVNSVSYGAGDFFHRDPSVTRVAVPMARGAMTEGFLVETWTERTNMLHHTLVAGNGKVLHVEERTNTDSYNVFPDHPLVTSQTVVNGPGSGNTESPNGWLFGSGQTTVNIAGNNVNAYLDTDANNSPDGGGSAVNDGNFLTSANLSQEPETSQNKAAAVQNLFYFNNVIHDKLYRHGFTESVGNFQENNFGQGGSGSDSVNAEAQDGSGTNNANFATPNDGSNPRMQMFVWTTTSPKRDGDFDSDIIWHEYGHGLTWRMIGNMSGTMSGAIGEGMSDVLSIYINDDDTVGEYSTDDPFGVRSAPYTNYGRTYGDFSGTSVHFNGEIYAATMWRLKQLWEADGLTMDQLFDVVVDGMNFTPSGPAFEDMRDGLLASADTQQKDCLIWEAFSQFGIGVGADARVRGGRVTVTESFSQPAECGGGPGECAEVGESCRDDADCCSNSCSGGKPSTRVCLAN